MRRPEKPENSVQLRDGPPIIIMSIVLETQVRSDIVNILKCGAVERGVVLDDPRDGQEPYEFFGYKDLDVVRTWYHVAVHDGLVLVGYSLHIAIGNHSTTLVESGESFDMSDPNCFEKVLDYVEHRELKIE